MWVSRLPVSVIALALAGALVAGCGGGQSPMPAPGSMDADRFLHDRGQEELAKKHWFQARVYFTTLVDTYPTSPYRYAAKLGTKAGFVHQTDVSANPDVRLSGQGVRETYSTTETSAARKGFNPQVEQQYRADNPNLDRAFRAIDALEARELPEADLRTFLADGGLLREGQ